MQVLRDENDRLLTKILLEASNNEPQIAAEYSTVIEDKVE